MNPNPTRWTIVGRKLTLYLNKLIKKDMEKEVNAKLGKWIRFYGVTFK